MSYVFDGKKDKCKAESCYVKLAPNKNPASVFFCPRHLALYVAPSASPALPDWLGRSKLGGSTPRPGTRTTVTALASRYSLEGVSWLQIFQSAHTLETFATDLTDLDTTTPRTGMSFVYGTCSAQSGSAFSMVALGDEKPLSKKPGSACYEADVFETGYAAKDGDILVIHQSHAPCSACCTVFLGWAIFRAKPILIAYDYGKPPATPNNGAYVFLPQQGSKKAEIFFMPWDGHYEETSSSSSSSSSSSPPPSSEPLVDSSPASAPPSSPSSSPSSSATGGRRAEERKC